MATTILYIATSLDGFIARPDGALDWLTSVPAPASGDYGYGDLLQRIGTIVMGRKTYEEVIGFGVEWPYAGFDTYVVTSNDTFPIKSPDTFLMTGDLSAFMAEKQSTTDKDIWLVGGGELITGFLNGGLIDRMIITIIPRIIGEGIRLFAGTPVESAWTLVDTQRFETGVVMLTYDTVRHNDVHGTQQPS